MQVALENRQTGKWPRKRWFVALVLAAVPVLFFLATLWVSSGPTRTVAVSPADAGQYVRIEGLYTDRGSNGADSGLPIVWFRVRNIGKQTVTDVTVRVSFLDETGKSVHTVDFVPVHSGYDPEGTAHALAPGTAWQMPFNQFYMPKDIPWTWKTGSARAEIVALRIAAN